MGFKMNEFEKAKFMKKTLGVELKSEIIETL